MLFFSLFKTLVGKEVVVESKNGICISGTLQAVDQYMNMKMTDISASAEHHPQLSSIKSCFIRGSVIQFVHLPAESVDVKKLHEATLKELRDAKAPVTVKKQTRR